MGIHTMGFQGGGDSNGKQSQFQPLVRQNSIYSLTLDEIHNQLGNLGKPLSSMNLDELLKTVWIAEPNQSMGMDESTAQASQTSLQRQASLSLTSALSKKTVDELWRDIQQSKSNEEKKSRERQPTLGEMTLEDFLVKAGIVGEESFDGKNPSPLVGVDSNIVVPQFPQQGQWMQYPQAQYQHPQQSFADTPTPGRKRGILEDMIEKTVERRQKRMIKNRESAARSRARKHAYTYELEQKVSRLEEENESLRKQKELEKMLPCPPPPWPKFQLGRTTSAPF